MKQGNTRNVLTSLLVALTIVLVSAPVWAQKPADPLPKACCSNFRVYAGSLLDELTKLCQTKPDAQAQVHEIVNDFIGQVLKIPFANQAQECVHIKPKFTVGKDEHALHGCYDPRKLLEKYMAAYAKGMQQCPPPQSTTVVQPPNPCDPPQPDNGCGNTTIVVMPVAFPTALPVNNFNTFNFNVSYTLGENNRSEKPSDPKAPEPLQPQVPTENVFGTSQTGLLRPSETRLAAVQMPVVITDNGTYGTAGVSFSPYKIYQLESDSGDSIGSLERVPLLGRFLKRINVSLGATKSPGMMEQAGSANGAVAISLQHRNDHDPYLNEKFGKCLRDVARVITDARKEACADQKEAAAKEECLANHIASEETRSRSGFRQCLGNHARSAASTVLGASAELVKAWYTYEGSWNWYLSWLAYGGMEYNRRHDVFVPAEAGGQISLTTASCSAHLDATMMAGATDSSIKFRPTGGLGISLPTFNGMSANFGVRFMPLAWDDSWSHDPFSRMEKRYVVGIGWAGEDVAIKYYRKTLENKKP
ncbi:MAG: hypothetical protein WCW31_00960 [Patescibacteria group bacterium]|jgi:hypothetical protein